MKTIYGMAKSYLNLKGSKCRGFELDFLRLALARQRDRDCVGAYLCAPLPDGQGQDIVRLWNEKYGADVQFVEATLTATERELLSSEKERNANGNRAKGDRKLASAHFGETLIEQKLTDFIEKHHSGVEPRSWRGSTVLPEIKWDYFGIIES